MALGTTSSSRVCEGHWVTSLALSYGVYTSGMVHISIQELGTITIQKMWVLTIEAGQPQRVSGDDIVEPIRQVEPKVVPGSAFVRHQRPRNAEPDLSEPNIGEVMQGLTDAQQECHWMMDSLVMMMQHLGMDHPPFLSADPIVPSHFQPHNTSYYSTGPLGTHPGEADDDDDEEETETES
ncbi:unnamed protein product [Lactuca saligna]|uniref:Uncharacterized protein n=1 Tax=Lactuca saligna TaxID=75948 RepID=A0AA35ZUU2_LACSI|nr:unnamed protein product [Lactuca saligna]